MKFLISFAAFVAVAVAVPVQHGLVTPVAAGPAPIIAGPAVLEFEPISVGPAIVEGVGPVSIGPTFVDGIEPISVGPAIVDAADVADVSFGLAMIDFALPETAVATPVQPSPVIIESGDNISQVAPLVQIILNINQAAAESSPVAVTPVAVSPIAVADKPEPINVVDSAAEPINVVDSAEPIIVPSPVIIAPEINDPEAVIIFENVPVPVEPVIIGAPIIPAPAINLPDTLN